MVYLLSSKVLHMPIDGQHIGFQVSELSFQAENGDILRDSNENLEKKGNNECESFDVPSQVNQPGAVHVIGFEWRQFAR